MTMFWRRLMNLPELHFHRRPGAQRWEVIWEADRQRSHLKRCGTPDCERLTWAEFVKLALEGRTP